MGSRGPTLIALVVAIALVAFNSRASVTSVGPLLPDVRSDLDMSSTLASILTALPVLCFAVGAATVPRLMWRYQMDRAIAVALAVLAAGLLVRIGPGGVGALLAGTIVAGAAISIVNVLLPVLIKRDAPERAGLLTGTYAMMISVGAALGAGVTVPFADAVHGGWRSGLALWVLPVIPAVVHIAVRPLRAIGPVQTSGAQPRFLRGRVDWPVTLFFGFQSGVFYAAVGWLPTVLHDQGFTTADAGGLMSLALILGIPTGLLAPVAAGRRPDQRLAVVALVLLTAAGLVGLITVPDAAPLWMVAFGVGMGGTFPLALMLMVTRSTDPRDTEQISSAAQTLGYTFAIAGPMAVGELHALTGSWTPPLLLMAATMVLPTMIAGLAAARGPAPRH